MNEQDNNSCMDEPYTNLDNNDSESYIYLCKIFKTKANKIPWTVIYCMVFLNFGICAALFGPTILELACHTGSSLTTIACLYYIQNLTSLVGCIVSGLLVKHSK